MVFAQEISFLHEADQPVAIVAPTAVYIETVDIRHVVTQVWGTAPMTTPIPAATVPQVKSKCPVNPISGRLQATPFCGRGLFTTPLISRDLTGLFSEFKRHSIPLNVVYIYKKKQFGTYK